MGEVNDEEGQGGGMKGEVWQGLVVSGHAKTRLDATFRVKWLQGELLRGANFGKGKEVT